MSRLDNEYYAGHSTDKVQFEHSGGDAQPRCGMAPDGNLLGMEKQQNVIKSKKVFNWKTKWSPAKHEGRFWHMISILLGVSNSNLTLQ